MSVESGVVVYRRNGVLFYTSGVAPVYPLLVDTALYSAAATIADVVLSGDLGEAVAWTATAGVSASGSTLTKTAVAGWNAGAISTRAIAAGDGFVSFTTNESTTHKMLGLSQGNTNTNYTDIDFGILLAAKAGSSSMRAGRPAARSGRMRPAIGSRWRSTGGVVTYLKNGVRVLHERRGALVSAARRHRALHAGGHAPRRRARLRQPRVPVTGAARPRVDPLAR